MGGGRGGGGGGGRRGTEHMIFLKGSKSKTKKNFFVAVRGRGGSS